MNEYRCTRTALYLHPCLGRDDLTARQGHYVDATTPEMAVREMAEAFPQDVKLCPPGIAPFTATLVRENGVAV